MKRLWNLSLVNKVFFSYLAVALLLVSGFYFSSNTLIRDFHIRTLSGRMEQEAHLLGRVLPFGVEGGRLDAICRQLAGELGSRITVIALDGKVLGDSAEVVGENGEPRGRPEVIERHQIRHRQRATLQHHRRLRHALSGLLPARRRSKSVSSASPSP